MKLNAALLLALPLAILVTGCGADQFETNVRGQSTIQGSTGLVKLLNDLGPMTGFSNIDFNSNQDFKNQGVSKDDVDSVKIVSFTLTIISPATQDFSFLKNLQFFAEANGQKALIADKVNIDQLNLKAPNPTLTLDVKDVELKPFITAPAVSITTAGNGHQPDHDTTIQADIRLHVDVKVF